MFCSQFDTNLAPIPQTIYYNFCFLFSVIVFNMMKLLAKVIAGKID